MGKSCYLTRLLLALIIFAYSTIGCSRGLIHTPTIQINIIPSIINTPEISDVTPENITNTSTHQSEAITSPTSLPSDFETTLVRIAAGRVFGFWWSEDSTKLYYEIQEEQQTEIREYDVLSDSTVETPDLLSTVIPSGIAIETNLPHNATNSSVSPSELRMIYLISNQPAPSLQPTNGMDSGEIEGPRGDPVELWLYQNDIHRKIGDIRDCLLEYRWSNNERYVVAIPFSPQTRCGELIPIWVINLSNNEIQQLLMNPFEKLALYEMSPIDYDLLLNLDGILNLLDLDTLTYHPVSPPDVFCEEGYWIDQHTLIVGYRSSEESGIAIGILDLVVGTIIPILETDDPQLEDASIDRYVLSPNGLWVALSTSLRTTVPDGLWLLHINR